MDIIYFFMSPIYNWWLWGLCLFLLLAPHILNLVIFAIKDRCNLKLCLPHFCLATLNIFDQVEEGSSYVQDGLQNLNHLVFVVADLAMFTVQILNNIFVGHTLSWLIVLSPLFSLLHAIYCVARAWVYFGTKKEGGAWRPETQIGNDWWRFMCKNRCGNFVTYLLFITPLLAGLFFAFWVLYFRNLGI